MQGKAVQFIGDDIADVFAVEFAWILLFAAGIERIVDFQSFYKRRGINIRSNVVFIK